MPSGTAIGKNKWGKWLSLLQKQTRRAKRVGWRKGGYQFMQALGEFVYMVQHSGRGKFPRIPHPPGRNEYALSVRQIQRTNSHQVDSRGQGR